MLKPEHQERRNKMSTADLCILWKRPKIYKDIIYYATLATVLKSKNGNKKQISKIKNVLIEELFAYHCIKHA